MGHLFLIILIAVLASVLLLNAFRSPKRKRKKSIEKIRSQWGRPKTEYFNSYLIEKYSKVNTNATFHKLSDQTLADTDFHDLFGFIDRTTSKPGQQLLFDRLTRPGGTISELEDLNKKAYFFAVNPAIREDVQLALTHLSGHGACYIASLLDEQPVKKPKWVRYLFVDTLLTILLILFSPFYPVLAAWLLLPLAINIFLDMWNKDNISDYAEALPQLNKLIYVSKKLTEENIPFEKSAVIKSLKALEPFRKKLLLINFETSNSGFVDEVTRAAKIIGRLLKAFFLIELYAFYNIIDEVKSKRSEIETLFNYVGSVDTCISVASLRAGDQKTCEPVFVEPSKQLHSTGIYHPLIEDCITNDIHFSGKSVLITGSNMSGKSTFLRTIAINSILAQSIYTCFADSYSAPLVKLFSSIRIEDNLLEGKSYYFEEMNIMSSLVSAAGSTAQNLFILDEVFKGTNTVERIASAKAILSYLNKDNNIVFVATHDTELMDMLSSEYELYYFMETIDNDQLSFDHKIYPGKSKTRNAIKILDIAGYPKEIINEANEIAQKLAGS